MFKINHKEKQSFKENGYIKLRVLEDNNDFAKFLKSFKNDLSKISIDNKLEDIGGYKSGNLNIDPGKYGPWILKILENINFKNYFEFLTNDEFKNYKIIFGGNLNLKKSKKQLFHTDGNWNPRMVILNLATTEIDDNNGPLEVIKSSHKEPIPYWRFLIKYFKKDDKIKLNLKVGEVIIREHRLWHRGTSNRSTNNREMLGLMFLKTDKTIDSQTEFKENKIRFYDNMYDKSFNGKLREFLFLNLKFILVFYKVILSIIK